MSNMRKRKSVVYFDEPVWEALKKLSDKTGAPVAELVRRAVAEWLAKKK
jgi:Ribbon-helix-helix domain